MKSVTAIEVVEREIARIVRIERRRRAIATCRDWVVNTAVRARFELRFLLTRSAWRKCRSCGRRAAWHGHTEHIPFY